MSNGQDGPINRIAVSSRMLRVAHHLLKLAKSCVDRLPTVSASQALQQSTPTAAPPVPFGLNALDRFLAAGRIDGSSTGGIRRGQVVELYGPPGIGKTTLWYGISFGRKCPDTDISQHVRCCYSATERCACYMDRQVHEELVTRYDADDPRR